VKKPSRRRARARHLAGNGAGAGGVESGRLRSALAIGSIVLLLVAGAVAFGVGRSETPPPDAEVGVAGVPQLIYVWQPG
jgi:hypothetical protein